MSYQWADEPPGYEPTTEPLPGSNGLENETAFSPSKGKAVLMAEFGHDEWTARQHVRAFVSNVDARDVSMREFRRWASTHRPRKLYAVDTRVGGPCWPVVSR